MSETFGIEKSIKKIEIIFRCSGINIKRGQVKRRDIENAFVFILNFVWFNTDVLGAFVWFATGVIEGKNFTEITYVAPCATLSILANSKLIFLVYYGDKAHKLIDKLRRMEASERSQNMDAKKELIVKNEINFLNVVINVLVVVNFMVVVTFAVNPVVLMALKYSKTGEIDFLLPLLIKYPFNPFDRKVWPIIYVKQIWTMVLVILAICAADFLFFTFCTYLAIQFKLLCYNIQRIVPTKNSLNLMVTNNDEIAGKLKDLIRWHQDLVEVASMLEAIYTKSILCNFISSSVIICLTGFNVTVINDVAVVITFLSFLIMSLSQIFLLCFFGNKMMEASTQISDAVYNCKWYMTNQRLRKDFLITQIRGQRPCKLTAFGFADVNLRAFMKILSTAWSYFALLKTLYSTPNSEA